MSKSWAIVGVVVGALIIASAAIIVANNQPPESQTENLPPLEVTLDKETYYYDGDSMIITLKNNSENVIGFPDSGCGTHFEKWENENESWVYHPTQGGHSAVPIYLQPRENHQIIYHFDEYVNFSKEGLYRVVSEGWMCGDLVSSNYAEFTVNV